MEVIENYVCDVCKNYNQELVVLPIKILGIVPKDVVVCQSCISKSFRSLSKKK